jgi:hypothetical protein
MEDDEALFAAPILHLPATALFSARILHTQLPLMLLSYLGALKTWLYFPVLMNLGSSVLTVRIPVIVIGSLTVGLFVWLLKSSGGWKLAWVGGLLLASDSMFLFTTCFDWGPVALQHFLGLAGIALLYKFAVDGKRLALFGGFLCFGLALWDKALFLWFLSGLVVATIAIFPRELWARCTWRNFGLAAAGLCLGAAPLLIFNAAQNLATFRGNAAFDLTQIPSRLHALRITWDGQILWGYMVHAPWSPGTAREAGGTLERISGLAHAAAGFRYHNQMEPAFWLALALIPLLWFTRARRTLLFCLIAMTVAWMQMAITKGAGLGAHHVVLLWPLPHWFVAVAVVEASRWKRQAGAVALAVVTIFLVGENLLLTNEYFYQLTRYGALGVWSDAIYRLSDEARRMPATESLVVNDWGIANSLALLSGREVSLAGARTLGAANELWIGHTAEYEQRPAESERALQAARAAGLQKQLIETVPDRNGRPVFEIFRFVRSAN